jgi:hypothetical protein
MIRQALPLAVGQLSATLKRMVVLVAIRITTTQDMSARYFFIGEKPPCDKHSTTPEGYCRKHDEVCTQRAEAGHGMSWQSQRTFWIGACASLRRS